ncbi:Endoribonuclease Dcr-1-like [Oopsacas minuta]|uniref:Endoribonuclease Dcr-1-like n=1 Tax=Oopsacas minuta TaxID=111878 RepID=A0AAV7JKE9_9METZ|nr:Endoribonuclease Dcr-1-like [Oopsacas minuta]
MVNYAFLLSCNNIYTLVATSAVDLINLERQEFIGDSLLKLIISLHVFTHSNLRSEGDLTRLRTKFISNETLHGLAVKKAIVHIIGSESFALKKNYSPPGFAFAKNALVDAIANNIPDKDKITTSDGLLILSENLSYHTKSDPQVTSSLPFRFQQFSDKTSADCIEAVLSSYVCSGGIQQGMRFISYLDMGIEYNTQKIDSTLSKHDGEMGHFFNPPNAFSHYANEYEYTQLHLESSSEDLSDLPRTFLANIQGFQESVLNFQFENISLLIEAFTHPSFMLKITPTDNARPSYQRLEFLGDALLDYFTCVYIYQKNKDYLPEQLSQIRSAIVNNSRLGMIALGHQWHKCLLSNDRLKVSIENSEIEHRLEATQSKNFNAKDYGRVSYPKPLADIVEAIVAAVFLDSRFSLDTVWDVFGPIFRPIIDQIALEIPKNPINQLYNLKPKGNITFKVRTVENRKFQCVIHVEGISYTDIGSSHDAAKYKCAQKMALNEGKLKELFGVFNDFIYFNNKKQNYEESKRFWTDLLNDKDQLTAYIMSILCRIITVDSVPITKSLPDIYDALILKCDTKANFDAWTTALVKEKEKDKKKKTTVYLPDPKEVVILRSRLLLTLHFVVTFYPDYNIGQIGTLISRWKIARDSKLLDFELKTISLFGGIDTLDVPKLLRKGTLDQSKNNVQKQIDTLIKQCAEKKNRGMRDKFPDFSPSLCLTIPVSDSLCLIKLLSVLELNPVNYVTAITIVLQALADITKEEIRMIETLQPPTRMDDREQLLPYLQLFKEFVIRAPSVSSKILDQAYQTVYAFFLWPVPYCYFARDILNFIDAERICPGFSYRNRMLSEYNLQVKDSTINTYERTYLLIDYAAPQALSFRESFKKADKNESAVKIHILKRAFVSILGINIDLTLLDRILRTAGSDTLDSWLSELINNTHEVLFAGQLDSQEILNKHLINLLTKMIEFFNEKNPDDKIDTIADVTDSPTPIPFVGLNTDSLPDTPITVKFLNSLMDPQSPEDIIDSILQDGGANVRNSSRGKAGRGVRPISSNVENYNNKDSFNLDNVFPPIHRVGSDSKVEPAPRQTTMSEKIKTFQRNKRDGSLSNKPSKEPTSPGEEPGADDEVDNDDVIYVDILGNIMSAKQKNVPKSKRGILAKELREGRAVLKLVIAGDDKSVAMIIKKYLHVQPKHQMSDINVVFYYIPLSNADTVSGGEAQLLTSNIDISQLQDPLTQYFYENQPTRGGDIWMGRLLGHLDGWHENFVTLPIQCALQLYPQFHLNVDDSGDPEKMRLKKRGEPKGIPLPPSPIQIIRDTVINFTRSATRPMLIRNYYVDMIDARGKRIESVMCHRLEMITREIGQKVTQVGTIPKPASVRLSLHAIQIDGTPYSQIDVPFQRYFVLKASNIPKPGDFWAANPAEAGFQLHAVVGEKVGAGGLTSKPRYGPSDQRHGWYVKQVVIEAMEKESFVVSIDKENPQANITHLIIRPTRMDMKGMDKGPTQLLEELSVPFMTFWPVDL